MQIIRYIILCKTMSSLIELTLACALVGPDLWTGRFHASKPLSHGQVSTMKYASVSVSVKLALGYVDDGPNLWAGRLHASKPFSTGLSAMECASVPAPVVMSILA